MKIVQAIESAGPGGAEQVLLRLSTRLLGEGHEVRVLLLRSGWLKESLERQGIDVTVLPIARALDRSFLERLTKFLSDSSTDLLHSHEITFALYGRAATARLGIPHVATAHGRSFSKGWKRKGLGIVALRTRNRFRLVAVSDSLADALSRELLVDRSEVEVIPNGIEMPSLAAPRERRDGEPLRAVAVGNLYGVKNHALLIRAVAQVIRSGLPMELDILGRGTEEESLERLIDDLGVGDHVRLAGFRSDVPDFLARAHVFASSSLSEAMPLSFLEAMARGLPVVASRVGGVPEIVEHGVHGLLFESGSVEAAASALDRLMRDEALRLRLGESACASVHALYGAGTMVRRYLEIYGKVAA